MKSLRISEAEKIIVREFHPNCKPKAKVRRAEKELQLFFAEFPTMLSQNFDCRGFAEASHIAVFGLYHGVFYRDFHADGISRL